MRTLPQDPVPIRPVTIHVSREIAYDLDKLTKITATVLGRLGCPACHSGRILHYQILEDYVVNPKTLEVQEIAGTGFAR